MARVLAVKTNVAFLWLDLGFLLWFMLEANDNGRAS
jgi:hypothetical protein